MMDRYCRTMNKLTLSDSATAQFYEKLEGAVPAKKHRPVGLLVAAACLCVLIPLAAFAVKNSFGQPKSEPITNPPRAGKGYVVSVDNIYRVPISDFSPALQTLNGSEIVDRDSFQEAEDYIGFPLLDAPALFSGEIEKRTITLTADGKSHTYHCLTSFVGDGQLYMGHVEAYYRKGLININLRAKVAAEHPDMTDEMLNAIHRGGSFYIGNQVQEITTENITTQAGLPVCITTVHFGHSKDYEANFSINGVSFFIWFDGGSGEAEKALLLEILESIRVENTAGT